MSDPAVPRGPEPGDYELKAETVPISGGVSLVVAEMTLLQRDRLTAALEEFASDEDLTVLLGAFSAEDPEAALRDVPVEPIVRAIARRVGKGALTDLLALIVDAPENRAAFGETTARLWIQESLRISDETRILSAFGRVNDLAAYLRNLLGLLPLAVSTRADAAVGGTGTPAS